jgi:hypothetical protein
MTDIIEYINKMQEMYGDDVITTADKIKRPEPKQEVKEIEAFNEFNRRNPRIGFYKGMKADKAPKKIKLKEPKTLTGISRDRKLTKDQIDALDPNYLGDFEGGDLERPKKVYKSGASGSVLDDAIEIRNIIVNNKGNIFNLEELGEMAGIFGQGSRKSGKGNRPDIRRVKAALEVAKDNFSEITNFKFVTDRYNIDGSQRKQLNMVVDTIKNYQNSVGEEKLANFLFDNMGMFYKKTIEKGLKKIPANPEKALYTKMYNFNPEQIKYITDRITDETGQTFNAKDYKNLVKEVKDFRKNIASKVRQKTRLKGMHAKIVELANDDIIQNLLTGDLDRATQTELLERATDIVGGDASIASRRLFQMAEAMSDTSNAYKNLGIKINNNIANKIIATGRNIGGVNNRYGMSSVLYEYYGNVVDKALGAGEGKTFIGKYQQQIRNLLDKGRSPDEIFSLTASARRGLSPYAIFTQDLNTQVNSAIKGAYIDGALSRTHEKLQKIFKGRKWNQLNAADKKAANLLIEAFEKEKIRALNQPINPGEIKKGAKPIYLTAAEKKNIQLPEFDLQNSPKKSIANYASYGKDLQNAFDKSYNTVGYSMKVPKEYLTQKQMIANLTKGVSMFGTKGNIAAGIVAGVLGYKSEDILKGAGLIDKEYELTASAADAPIVEKGLSTGEKIAAGTAAAGTLGTKTGRKILGKTLSALTGPVPLASTYPIFGFDYKSPIDRIFLSGELAAAPSLVKTATSVTDKIKTPALRKAAELLTTINPKYAMRAARIASPIGIASLGAEGLYHLGKKGYDQYQLMKGMTESKKSDYLADQYEDLGGVFGEGAADGGLIGDKSGPPPESGPMSQGLRSLYKNGRKL